MASHQLYKFGGHRHCGSRDTMILGCHVISKDHVIKGSLTWWARAHQGKLLSCQVLWPQALWKWRYNDSSLPCDLTKPQNQRVMWLYGEKPIQENYNFVKFGGHRHCASEDIMILVCHMILQDHVIKGSCDFIDRSPSR